MSRTLTSNMEDYLETIYVLEMEKGSVRVKDISDKMNITMPSVSGAMKNLEKRGMLQHPKYDSIRLTLEGARVAEQIYQRHVVLKDFLNKVVGVSNALAERDACCMEHVVSPETVAGFSRMLDTWYQQEADRLNPERGSHAH